MRAADLLGVARAMDPTGDWRFLQRAVHSLAARAVPSRNKEPRIRPSAVLVELGFALMPPACPCTDGHVRQLFIAMGS
jgi:hypothetical protein